MEVNILIRTNIKIGPDREIQQGLANTMETQPFKNIKLTKGNLLDLVFESNPSLVKSSTNLPGISDHKIVNTNKKM